MSSQSPFSSLPAALYYASLGLRVTPVWGLTSSNTCLCPSGASCRSAGKHPIVKDWTRAASTDSRKIEAWWRQYPGCNVGIATSAEFTIMDIDVKNGGLQTFDKLVQQYGETPFKTPYRVRSGGGGLHLGFRSPPGTRSRDGHLPGIDRKAEGAMVLAPDSRHASGGGYYFDPAITALDLAALPPLPDVMLSMQSAAASSPPSPSSGKIAQGSRNITLTSIAGKLRDKGLDGTAIENTLRGVNQGACEPPLPDDEVRAIAASIAKYPAGVPPRIKFIGADELVATVPPNVEWIVPGIVALGAITELTGQPKEAGKSTLVRAMVAAMLAGSAFLGMQTMRASVVMLSEERDRTLSPAIALHAIASGELRVLQRHRIDGAASWPQIVEASVGEMKRIGAKVLVVDTLSYWAMGDVDENSAGDAIKAMEPLLKAAAEGIAIILVRHMRKSGGETVTSGRGSSAITGAVDIVCTLGSHSAGETFRVIDATGRFRESVFKAVIELTPSNTYVAHGTGQQLAQQARLALEDLIISLLPQHEASALAEKNILALLANTSTPIGRTKLSEILKELVSSSTISCKGRGTNNDPKRYWAP